MSSTKIDPLFAAYAKTAPLLDLQFYLAKVDAYADRAGQDTAAIVDAMRALAAELSGNKPGTTASQKRRVWAIIDRYRASMPQWYGDARTEYLTVAESEAAFWKAQRRITARKRAADFAEQADQVLSVIRHAAERSMTRYSDGYGVHTPDTAAEQTRELVRAARNLAPNAAVFAAEAA